MAIARPPPLPSLRVSNLCLMPPGQRVADLRSGVALQEQLHAAYIYRQLPAEEGEGTRVWGGEMNGSEYKLGHVNVKRAVQHGLQNQYCPVMQDENSGKSHVRVEQDMG